MQQHVQTDATCNIQQFGSFLPTMLRPFARGFTLANVKCKISRQGTPEPASTLILPIRSRRILTASSPFSMCQIETGWDYSRKKLLPRAFFARLHVTYSPSRQSRATAIRLKRITLRLLTNSSFSLLGPCAVCSLPLGQCLTKSLKTHRSRWIIRPFDGATLVSQTRHWLDLAGPKESVILNSIKFFSVQLNSKIERSILFQSNIFC